MRVGIDVDDVLFPWREQRPTWRDVTGPVLKSALYKAAPYPGVCGELARLQTAGHSVLLVTARSHEGGPHSAQIRALTRQWADEHEVPHDSLHYANDKTTIPVDVFLDDSLHNVLSLRAAGVAAFLLDREWNAYATGVRRVPSLAALVDLILGD